MASGGHAMFEDDNEGVASAAFCRKKMRGDKPANMVRLRTKTEAFVDMG
jgi:hypothetical protein